MKTKDGAAVLWQDVYFFLLGRCETPRQDTTSNVFNYSDVKSTLPKGSWHIAISRAIAATRND